MAEQKTKVPDSKKEQKPKKKPDNKSYHGLIGKVAFSSDLVASAFSVEKEGVVSIVANNIVGITNEDYGRNDQLAWNPFAARHDDSDDYFGADAQMAFNTSRIIHVPQIQGFKSQNVGKSAVFTSANAVANLYDGSTKLDITKHAVSKLVTSDDSYWWFGVPANPFVNIKATASLVDYFSIAQLKYGSRVSHLGHLKADHATFFGTVKWSKTGNSVGQPAVNAVVKDNVVRSQSLTDKVAVYDASGPQSDDHDYVSPAALAHIKSLHMIYDKFMKYVGSNGGDMNNVSLTQLFPSSGTFYKFFNSGLGLKELLILVHEGFFGAQQYTQSLVKKTGYVTQSQRFFAELSNGRFSATMRKLQQVIDWLPTPVNVPLLKKLRSQLRPSTMNGKSPFDMNNPFIRPAMFIGIPGLSSAVTPNSTYNYFTDPLGQTAGTPITLPVGEWLNAFFQDNSDVLFKNKVRYVPINGTAGVGVDRETTKNPDAIISHTYVTGFMFNIFSRIDSIWSWARSNFNQIEHLYSTIKAQDMVKGTIYSFDVPANPFIKVDVNPKTKMYNKSFSRPVNIASVKPVQNWFHGRPVFEYYNTSTTLGVTVVEPFTANYQSTRAYNAKTTESDVEQMLRFNVPVLEDYSTGNRYTPESVFYDTAVPVFFSKDTANNTFESSLVSHKNKDTQFDAAHLLSKVLYANEEILPFIGFDKTGTNLINVLEEDADPSMKFSRAFVAAVTGTTPADAIAGFNATHPEIFWVFNSNGDITYKYTDEGGAEGAQVSVAVDTTHARQSFVGADVAKLGYMISGVKSDLDNQISLGTLGAISEQIMRDQGRLVLHCADGSNKVDRPITLRQFLQDRKYSVDIEYKPFYLAILGRVSAGDFSDLKPDSIFGGEKPKTVTEKSE